MTASPAANHVWTFQRMGGLDQVVLEKAEDLYRLGELDPKLWVALSCPASGLEFDARTLTLLDTDKDGRIRIPEVVAAVQWTCLRLADPAGLFQGADELPLSAIDATTPEGQRLADTCRAILHSRGKDETGGLTQEDVTQAAAHASEQVFNGDGILPPMPTLEPEVRDFIQNALDVVGGVVDAGGQIGINQEIADAFMKTLADWHAWRKSVSETTSPLGADTPEAWELLSELGERLDDYFLRCEIAAYAPSEPGASGGGPTAAKLDPGTFDMASLALLPLSRVAADRPLELTRGINPAWRDRVERFAALIGPLLEQPGRMTRDDWRKVRERFAPYAQVLVQKPVLAAAATTTPPTSTAEKLGDERIQALLDGDVAARFAELAREDADVPAAAADIAEAERLVLYHRHLYRLLVNFASFEDFYAMRSATFQCGTLYVDGRSCRLCLPAEKVDEHSALAARSQLYLLYCRCTRGKKPGTSDPERVLNIVAAVTAGDSDLLMQNRNGVFVDNQGDDWDATVVKIVSNPIGLWQAVWSPYKRFGNLVTEQLNKFASDQQTGLMTSASAKLQSLGTAPAPAAPPATAPAAPARFDIARNVGIFAAIGLALGAIGTALASIARALFAMEWWQFPLVLFGLFVLISGPSLIMAWLKLRQRTLGPLLEASGWAVNGRVAINYTLAGRLTRTAELPESAVRSMRVPLAENRRWSMTAFFLALVVGAAATLGWLWYGPVDLRSRVKKTVEEEARKLEAPTTPPAPSTAPAAATASAPAPAPSTPPAAAPAK